MDPLGDPWSLSPSGSRADDPWPEETFQTAYDAENTQGVYTPTAVPFDEDDAMFAGAFGAVDLPPGQLMSTKIPPAFNGKGSWFAYEELVYDWMDITVLEAEKRGPFLKSRLHLN